MLLSGSAFGRARCCLWSFRPEVVVPSHDSADAARGTDRHAVMEALRLGTPVEPAVHAAAWGCTPEEWPAIEANIREWLPADGQSEVAVYYDTDSDTARAEVGEGHRQYTARPGEIPMTIDMMRTGEVWDYKFGRQEHLEPARDNGQIAICCLAAARLQALDSIKGTLALVADDGTARFDSVELDSLDLDAIAYEARGLMRAAPNSEPAPGPWCEQKWCPARAQCPATQAAIVATPVAPLSLTIDSPETCARVHVQIGLAEAFLDEVKKARNAWLENNPAGCELADGSTLCMGVEERDSIVCNGDVIAILCDHGCKSAVEAKTSKAAIERAIKATAPKGEAASMLREVLSALDSAGAIKTSQYTKIKVKKGRKAA